MVKYDLVMGQYKINKWNYSALKDALEDAVKAVLVVKFEHIEDFFLVDCRLWMCAFAVLVAAFAHAWDVFNPFPKSRPVLVVCVFIYYFMMGLVTLYLWYVEKNIFSVTLKRDATGFHPDIVLEASSRLDKHTGVFHLTFVRKDSFGRQVAKAEVSKSVSNYFNVAGVLCWEMMENEVAQLRRAVFELHEN